MHVKLCFTSAKHIFMGGVTSNTQFFALNKSQCLFYPLLLTLGQSYPKLWHIYSQFAFIHCLYALWAAIILTISSKIIF
jgi:hypothetical protein